MKRRIVVAAVVVAAAFTVGIVRSVTVHDQDRTAPAPVATAAPTVAAPTVVTRPSSSGKPTAPSSPPPSAAVPEPVDEGAGEEAPQTGAGRDTGPAGTDSAGDDRQYWEPVASGFGRTFTTVRAGDRTSSWRARLRPYVTDAVDKQLATVDIANVPRGQFDGLDVLDSSDEQVTVQATYQPGWALVLYLISDGHDHWKVYRYDRLEQ